jgi:YggT family protein
VPLLDAITQIELFVTVFASVYALVLVVYVLLSWVRVPGGFGSMQRFLNDVCEPYLRFWRRLLPFSTGPIDFSPMVAIIAVYAAGQIVNVLLAQLH